MKKGLYYRIIANLAILLLACSSNKFTINDISGKFRNLINNDKYKQAKEYVLETDDLSPTNLKKILQYIKKKDNKRYAQLDSTIVHNSDKSYADFTLFLLKHKLTSEKTYLALNSTEVDSFLQTFGNQFCQENQMLMKYLKGTTQDSSRVLNLICTSYKNYKTLAKKVIQKSDPLARDISKQYFDKIFNSYVISQQSIRDPVAQKNQ